MQQPCPRCRFANRSEARFCARCGLTLDLVPGLPRTAGHVKHPQPEAVPEQFERCNAAEDLYFRWKAAWGNGTFLGTEPIALTLFNAGYPLESVELKVEGTDGDGTTAFAVVLQTPALPRGRQVGLEVSSYELSRPVDGLTVSLVSAEFGSEEPCPP
ncbi:MAG: hypothetical protein ACE5F9_03830 [Phycisphaerae bacterium]